MRFIVVGAGAVGGVVGGRLFQHGHPVLLVARGAHGRALRDRGLRLESPEGAVELRIPTVEQPADIAFRDGDVVLLAVKGQDTAAVLKALQPVAPPTLAIACLQNGVENERLALRFFSRVYAVCVMCPASHLTPGVVQACSSPVAGLLDVGRHPDGLDDTAHALAAAFSASGFGSQARPDIARWKHAKLLMNLGNALEAACGPEARRGVLAKRARQEGVAALQAAGIAFASPEEDAARRADLVQIRPVAGRLRGGGSTWQSLARGAGTVEVDYLNGEIVLLGRLHGVPTPVNALLQRVAHDMARDGVPAGSLSLADLERWLAAGRSEGEVLASDR